MPREQHKLRLISLRDTQAECSCGRWSYLSPARDDQADSEIRSRVSRYHHQHRQNITKLKAKS
jgi:hypothetical protein